MTIGAAPRSRLRCPHPAARSDQGYRRSRIAVRHIVDRALRAVGSPPNLPVQPPDDPRIRKLSIKSMTISLADEETGEEPDPSVSDEKGIQTQSEPRAAIGIPRLLVIANTRDRTVHTEPSPGAPPPDSVSVRPTDFSRRSNSWTRRARARWSSWRTDGSLRCIRSAISA